MKRFTETNKWDDPWFVRLPWQLKLLWLYICDRCDKSGVIDFCAEVASVHIGHSFKPEALSQFGESRVNMLPNGKWQILKFIPFQYGTVDANCPAHKPVIAQIHSNGIQYPIKNKNRLSERVFNTLEEEENKKKSNTLSLPYSSPTYSQKPKEKAPIYDKLPPKRIPSAQELAAAQAIAKEETQKLRAKLKP